MQDHYLVHYYKLQGGPFRSLSLLTDEEALRIMRSLADDTIFGARFKDPEWYLSARRMTEQWTRAAFIAKGGMPREPAPVYLTLGRSDWIEHGSQPGDPHPIAVPLSVFDEGDVSFTYPDSMVSAWFAKDKPAPFYDAELHGKVFTRTEILALLSRKGASRSWKLARLSTWDCAVYRSAGVESRAPEARHPFTGGVSPCPVECRIDPKTNLPQELIRLILGKIFFFDYTSSLAVTLI
jgi:hypothetical protein